MKHGEAIDGMINGTFIRGARNLADNNYGREI